MRPNEQLWIDWGERAIRDLKRILEEAEKLSGQPFPEDDPFAEQFRTIIKELEEGNEAIHFFDFLENH